MRYLQVFFRNTRRIYLSSRWIKEEVISSLKEPERSPVQHEILIPIWATAGKVKRFRRIASLACCDSGTVGLARRCENLFVLLDAIYPESTIELFDNLYRKQCSTSHMNFKDFFFHVFSFTYETRYNKFPLAKKLNSLWLFHKHPLRMPFGTLRGQGNHILPKILFWNRCRCYLCTIEAL